MLGNVLGKGILWIGGTKKGLDGEEHGADLKGRTPFVFEYIKADAPQLVDVGVVDLGQETNLKGERVSHS